MHLTGGGLQKTLPWPITSDYFYVPGGALQRPQVEFLFALPLEV